MCAIIGYSGPGDSGEDLKCLQNLIRESRIRGVHSFGMAWVNDAGEVETFKAHTEEDLVAHLLKTWPATGQFLFHLRYSTSGDWKDHKNNQPILRHGIAMCFNGTLHMGTKREMEAEYHVSLETENDCELALLALHGKKLKTFVEETQGTFAGGWLTKDGLGFMRNLKRPLWSGQCNDGIFVASTRDIFGRAFKRRKLRGLGEIPAYYKMEIPAV